MSYGYQLVIDTRCFEDEWSYQRLRIYEIAVTFSSEQKYLQLVQRQQWKLNHQQIRKQKS